MSWWPTVPLVFIETVLYLGLELLDLRTPNLDVARIPFRLPEHEKWFRQDCRIHQPRHDGWV